MFPVSDHASDVTGALERKMRSLGVKIFLNEPVKDIVIREEKDEPGSSWKNLERRRGPTRW